LIVEVGEQVGRHGAVNVEGALDKHDSEATEESQDLSGSEGHLLINKLCDINSYPVVVMPKFVARNLFTKALICQL